MSERSNLLPYPGAAPDGRPEYPDKWENEFSMTCKHILLCLAALWTMNSGPATCPALGSEIPASAATPTKVNVDDLGARGDGKTDDTDAINAALEETPAKDKRMLLVESEFGSVLRVMQRNGSTVSAMIRNAWDTGTLRNLANKNRDKNGKALRATNCHISLIGHITRSELSTLLDENDSSNGFANRFLWVHSSRTKLLPDGGDIHGVSFDAEIKCLRLAVQNARV